MQGSQSQAVPLTEHLQPPQVESLGASMALLGALKEALSKRADVPGVATHGSRHLISAAALIGNPEAVKAFAKTAVANEGITGEVKGLEEDKIVPGVAVDGDGTDVGRFVVIELRVPLDAH